MKKILIIDDSGFARATLRRILQKAGYEVHEASSGLEALELLPSLKPDLVTLDLLMPEMEGRELIGHLHKLCRDCPMVVISADIQSFTHQEMIEAGAAGFLNKPVVEQDLLALVQKLCA